MENAIGTNSNDTEEDLGSLIRASIDIDSWISNEKEIDDSFHAKGEHEIAEGTKYSNSEPWQTEYCGKEFCDLGKMEKSDSPPFPETENYDFDGVICAQEATQQENNFFYQVDQSADDQSNRSEEIGNFVTLEKTPAEIRYQDIMNQRQIDQETVPNFNETEVAMGNLVSIINPDEKYQNSTARKTINCYKCHETVDPQDWTRSISAGAKDSTAVYHINCFYCDYCKGVLCTDQHYTFHNGKLICNFDFQMLTNLRKVTDHGQKRLVVLHSVKKREKKNVQISYEQREILRRALRNKDKPTNF